MRTIKTINANTKRGQAYINEYNNNGRYHYYSIEQAYNKPSQAKINAWDQCKKWCDEDNGKGIKITGKNCNMFTVMYESEEGLHVETAQNSYIIK